MSLQPSNFYITVIDLFAILLPGAIGALFLGWSCSEGNIILEGHPICEFIKFDLESQKIGSFQLLVFLFLAYLLGHLINQIGSYVDDLLYDKLKYLFFPGKTRLNRVKDIRERKYLHNTEASKLSNFQWSIFKLQKDQSPVYAEVERYMAESKFFRGLFVVLIIIAAHFAFLHNSLATCIFLFLLSIPALLIPFRNWAKTTISHYKSIEIKRRKLISKLDFYLDMLGWDLYQTKDEFDDTVLKKEIEKNRIEAIKDFDERELERKKYKKALKEKKIEDLKKAGCSMLWFSIIISFAFLTPLIVICIADLRLGLLILLTIVFSLIRYFIKRQKSTETAYKYIIFQEDLSTKKVSSSIRKFRKRPSPLYHKSR